MWWNSFIEWMKGALGLAAQYAETVEDAIDTVDDVVGDVSDVLTKASDYIENMEVEVLTEEEPNK